MIKQYDVICPHCCGCFHETNEHFKADSPAKGHMFTVKTHVSDAGWSCFPPYDTTEYMDIACPSCGQPYVDSLGMVIRLSETGEIKAAEDKAYLNDIMDRLVAEYEPDVPAYRPEAATVYTDVKPSTPVAAVLFQPKPTETPKRRGRRPKGE